VGWNNASDSVALRAWGFGPFRPLAAAQKGNQEDGRRL
jgi:hypothetical protein